ncbi:unnamed protein product [Rotaria sp. Silwood2]|nr:unnamed protein product [Rotaria sp. Silwood2]
MIIERVCRKHNIPFLLIYGSLLGSYRQRDVIPWDDDIGIMIPIEEHTRFINIIKQMILQKKEYVFPLVMRSFGELWLPTLRKPQEIFKFDPFDDCKGHTWNHRNEIGQKEIYFKCNDLKHIYPFVERQNQSDSMKILRTNDTIIHTVFFITNIFFCFRFNYQGKFS